jgi:uncharacterized protein
MIPQDFFTKLQRFCKESKLDKTHNYDHFLAVYNHALKAIECYEKPLSDNNKMAILYAALLHDVDDRKFFPKNMNHENARKLLTGVSNEIIYYTLAMISLVSCSVNGNSQKGVYFEWMLIPRISDRLEAIGHIGIKRVLEYGNFINRPMHTVFTQRARTPAELWEIATDKRFQNYLDRNKHGDTTMDHFYDKLLHIGKTEKWGIDNVYLVNEGKRRHEEMIDFVLGYWRDVEQTEVNPKYIYFM